MLEIQDSVFTTFDFITIIRNIFLCGFFGFLITLSHSYFSFKWFRNDLNIHVGIVLPILGLTIVTVIGSNIALSLGMIGALSIVRFRTPIRSAYELVIYFSLLTVGISCSVNIYVSAVLAFILILLPPLIKKFSQFINNYKSTNAEENIYNISLDFEGSMEKDNLQELASDENIKSYSVVKTGEEKIIKIKGLAFFNTIEQKSTFLEKWKSCIQTFNVSKEN